VPPLTGFLGDRLDPVFLRPASGPEVSKQRISTAKFQYPPALWPPLRFFHLFELCLYLVKCPVQVLQE
jgi:hypothetical protein